MTVPERVTSFLCGKSGQTYCDDCIKAHLGLARRQQVQQFAASLAVASGFERRVGICSTCGREKQTISAP
jgi:hypothetical protein